MFIAGPVLNLECFVACATAAVTASAEDCHRGAASDSTIGSAPDCGNVVAHVVPFVKSSELSPLALAAPAAETIDGIEAPSRPAPTPGLLDTGPPNRPTVIALRI